MPGPAPAARPTILVVDDEAQLCAVIAKVLRRAGYQVLAASDAHQASRILDGPDAIDLLLTDISIPGSRNGFDLADSAKTAYPALHVLYCSGHLHPERDHKGRIHGSVLAKPFAVPELLAAVRLSLKD